MVATRHHYSFEDYLGVEEASAVRHEFLNGDIFAMAGGTPEHAALSAAVVVVLGAALRGGPCRTYSSDLRVRVSATGLATYPDAAVICGPASHDPMSPTHVTNPSVLIEVLSTSTADYDRGEKREHYQRIDALREYVLIEQVQRVVEVFARSADGTWSHQIYRSGAMVRVPSLSVSFAVDEIYAIAGL